MNDLADVSSVSTSIAVLLVDDHRLVREGLQRLLQGSPDIRVVGAADGGQAALQQVRELRPQVVVVDLSMPGMPGIDLIRRVKAEWPQIAVLVLSMHTEEQYAVRALRVGANGYLTKDSAGDELVRAIRKVAHGGAYLSPALAERVALELNGRREQPSHAQLTNREFEIFRLIMAGQRLTDIANSLHLSVKTVSTHKSRILEKMGLDSTAALIKYGLTHRLFEETGLDEAAAADASDGQATEATASDGAADSDLAPKQPTA